MWHRTRTILWFIVRKNYLIGSYNRLTLTFWLFDFLIKSLRDQYTHAKKPIFVFKNGHSPRRRISFPRNSLICFAVADQMGGNNNNLGRKDLKISAKYFDANRPECQPLLLPDEYCLAEDEKASFDLYADRVGFHPFGGIVSFDNIAAKIYLTNYRVMIPFSGRTDKLVDIYSGSKGETQILNLLDLYRSHTETSSRVFPFSFDKVSFFRSLSRPRRVCDQT